MFESKVFLTYTVKKNGMTIDSDEEFDMCTKTKHSLTLREIIEEIISVFILKTEDKDYNYDWGSVDINYTSFYVYDLVNEFQESVRKNISISKSYILYSDDDNIDENYSIIFNDIIIENDLDIKEPSED